MGGKINIQIMCLGFFVGRVLGELGGEGYETHKRTLICINF